MAFSPKYTITQQLLANIKRIASLVESLNHRCFPKVVMAEFAKSALAVSSFASTSIEGNPLPLTEVKKILKHQPENIRDSEREVLNYNQTLSNLNDQIAKQSLDLSVPLILKIHSQVMAGLLPVFQTGALRQQPVTVNDPRTARVVFLPPEVKEVNPLITELLDFVKQSSQAVDPLIVAGIFHKQMVLIHPFMDGNGRTTRLATKVLLAKMGLNTFRLFSFENYYNQNVSQYFQTVGEYGDYHDLSDKIDFTAWLEYFTGGLIDELLRVQELLLKVANTPKTQLQPHHEAILKFIRHHNFISDRDYAKLTKRARATRALDFQKLLDLELISRRGKGKSTYYILKTDES
jgi:Fic family protein